MHAAAATNTGQASNAAAALHWLRQRCADGPHCVAWDVQHDATLVRSFAYALRLELVLSQRQQAAPVLSVKRRYMTLQLLFSHVQRKGRALVLQLLHMSRRRAAHSTAHAQPLWVECVASTASVVAAYMAMLTVTTKQENYTSLVAFVPSLLPGSPSLHHAAPADPLAAGPPSPAAAVAIPVLHNTVMEARMTHRCCS